MQILHPRKLLLGTNAERLALVTTDLAYGLCFLETDTDMFLYWVGDAWRELVNDVNFSAPVESLTFVQQAIDLSGPATDEWTLYFKAGGLFFVDDLNNVYGPVAIDVENLGATGEGIFDQNLNGVLKFKRLVGGDNVIITDTGNTLEFDVSGAVNGSNAGVNVADANIFIDVTGGNQLNFNGILGTEGISAVEDTGDNEVVLALDYPNMTAFTGDIIEDTDDLFAVYDLSDTAHVSVTRLQILNPAHAYISYDDLVTGITVTMTTADTYYGVHGTSEWNVDYQYGELTAAGNGISSTPTPDRATRNLVHAHINGDFPSGTTTVAVLLEGAETTLKAYVSGAGRKQISVSGIIETTTTNDVFSIGVSHDAGSEDFILYAGQLVVQVLYP